MLKRNAVRIIVGAVLLVVLAIGGWFLWQYLSSYESTDDAQIDGHVYPVSARIAGTLKAVYVEENQHVKAGQLLAEIDPADYQTALAHAEASVAEFVGEADAASPNVPITETTTSTTIATSAEGVTAAQAALAAARQNREAAVARLRQAEADDTVAQADLARYAALVQKEEVSRQQYDRQVDVAKSAEEAVAGNRAAVAAAAQQVTEAEARLQQAESTAAQATSNAGQQVAIQSATVQQKNGKAAEAKAQLDQARLDLSYTKINAPADGVVGQKNAEIGMRVQAGQALMAVVELRDIWVTANYKETQLRRVRPGQPVTIHVDTFDADYDGYVESMPAATGAEFSLLPPENATGNYVKVVQRLGVRIRFHGRVSPDERLRPGMSVETKIRLR
ncbi:MAG: HlyD family secretion protein [Bryobacteraceae bacterium]|jgi:membrane fusion protein (multidrug efflux system)